MSRLLSGLLPLALFSCADAPEAWEAEAIGRDKVVVCHNTSSATNPVVIIEVSTRAWQAHERLHGDWLVVDEIPGNGIDDDCDPTTSDTPDDTCDDLSGDWTADIYFLGALVDSTCWTLAGDADTLTVSGSLGTATFVDDGGVLVGTLGGSDCEAEVTADCEVDMTCLVEVAEGVLFEQDIVLSDPDGACAGG